MGDTNILVLLGIALVWGLQKGTMVCAVVCAPSLIPYITGKGFSWFRGFMTGVVFNLPRILLLTIVGGIVGYASFELVHSTQSQNVFLAIGVVGYLLVALLLLGYGGYTLAHAIEERENIKSGIKKVGCGSEHALQKNKTPGVWCSRAVSRLIGGLKKREKSFLLVWGSVLGLACIGEVIVTLEIAILSGVTATFGASSLDGMLLGATAMFMFAIGASIPVVLVTTISGGLSRKKSIKTLNSVKLTASIVMIAIGLFLVIVNLPRLIP